MNRDGLLETWRAEERKPVVGWDWSRLKNRRFSEPLPWSFEECVRTAMAGSSSVLDLGTGGGERLAAMQDALPRRTVATEAWRPNRFVAQERLKPLGIPVLAAAGEYLPLRSESFSLIINRQAAYDSAEIARVLKPGGTYWTQQLESSSRTQIRSAFGRSCDPWIGSLEQRVAELHGAGLKIETMRSHVVMNEYTDVAALVSYLAGMPWVVPGFSVDADCKHLFALHQAWLDGESLRFSNTFLLIEARRGA